MTVNLIRHPFGIASQGYAIPNQKNGQLEERVRPYSYQLRRLNCVPATLVDAELTGFSGMTLGNVNINDTNIKCIAAIESDNPVNPNTIVLYYKFLGFQLKQVIKDNSLNVE
ncbi:hypothetical protein [Desulfosporosinus orientis]|nr:hypothetical protein [Desulfosporosinus orientis]